MRMYSIALLTTLAWCVSGITTLAQDPIQSKKRPLKPVMQLKLDYSKDILEGLAMEDYEKIRKSSQELGLLSLESGWKILQTEEYSKQSLEFRRTVDLITEAAREENLDRAALGYVALTVRCIECHGYLRKQHPDLRSTVPAKRPFPAKKPVNQSSQQK